jgi:hypothetical protein
VNFGNSPGDSAPENSVIPKAGITEKKKVLSYPNELGFYCNPPLSYLRERLQVSMAVKAFHGRLLSVPT